MIRAILIVFVLLGSYTSWSQAHLLKYEIQLVVENDAFTGSLTQDQYYSSGIYPTFRMLKDSTEKAKVIRSYQINHRMYTPSWIGWDRIERFDRPYAGLLSASAANEYYFNSGSYLKAELEVGIMGPHAFVGNAQRTWHRWFNMAHPEGWKYEIRDSPVLNVHLKGIYPLVKTQKLDILSESSLSAGTIYTFLRQDMVVRLGDILPIHQSGYTSSTLGKTGHLMKHQAVQESYFFYSPGMEYVAYNATLEGNLIGAESVNTVESVNWVWQHRAGFIFSWPMFDLGMIAYWRKKENPEARNHNYVGIRLNQRF